MPDNLPKLLLFIALAWFPVSIVHELGHLAVAAWRGARRFRLTFGDPRHPKVELPIPVVPLRLHLGIGLWLTPPRITWEQQPGWRPWERIVVAAAGPLTALGLFALLGGSLVEGPALFFTARYPVHDFVTASQFMALLSFITPLIPWRYRSLNGFPSDGLRIMEAIRDSARLARAQSRA